MALLSPDGRLLDERPVVARVEKIGFSLSIGGGTAQEFAVGDPEGPPSVDERDEAIRLARDLEREARKAAAARRMSASGELTAYLHWRFSCRAGELLVADPFLLGSDPEAAAALLAAMRRPVRALSGGIPETARDILSASGEWLEVRALQGGRKALRDRVWIVGETGLLVGTSITDLVREASSARAAATTVTELPSADTVAWREQFEQWWRNAHSLGRA